MDRSLLATHPLCSGKGELVRNSGHSRDKSNSSAQHHQQVYLLLGSDEKASMYLELLKKDKPRYYHDNLRAIIKGTKGIGAPFIRQSLSYCLENGLYNGTGFSEVAKNYRKIGQQANSPKANITVSCASLHDNTWEMGIQVSDITTYENLIGSWNI
jgi:hypothetical protein